MKMYKALIIPVILLILMGCVSENRRENNLENSIPKEKLIIYTSHKREVYEPLIREFEERTGIMVYCENGGTMEMLNRVAEDAPFSELDIMFGGGVESLEAYAEHFIEYKAKGIEKINKEYISKDNRWTAFSNLPMVFIYNKKLLSEEEAPKYWNDFMDSKWKGKISFADPENSGTSCTILSGMYEKSGYSMDEFIEKFKAQIGNEYSENSGTVLSDINRGRFLVGITLEEAALKNIANGKDLGMIYPYDGSISVPDGAAIVKNADNLENAKKFIDFIISKDVQRVLEKSLYRRTVYSDEFMESAYPYVENMEFNIVKTGADQRELLKRWREE